MADTLPSISLVEGAAMAAICVSSATPAAPRRGVTPAAGSLTCHHRVLLERRCTLRIVLAENRKGTDVQSHVTG